LESAEGIVNELILVIKEREVAIKEGNRKTNKLVCVTYYYKKTREQFYKMK
jgi:hypothetical protein